MCVNVLEISLENTDVPLLHFSLCRISVQLYNMKYLNASSHRSKRCGTIMAWPSDKIILNQKLIQVSITWI